jgi:diguanylate cyclase (GGDEF)-like protein
VTQQTSIQPGAGGQERRRFRRYPVALDVTIRDATQRDVGGRVRDLCLGGAFVGGVPADWLGGVAVGDELDLRISMPSEEGLTPLSARALVVRKLPGSFAISFQRPSTSTAKKLQQFIEASLETGARGAQGRASGARLGNERADNILSRMTDARRGEILDAWLAAVEEALWHGAEHAADDNHRRRLGDDAVRFSQLRRSEGPNGLRQWLEQRTLPAARSATTQDGQDLQLVDPENFETWLESSSLVSYLEDDLGEPLRALHSQVDTAFGGDRSLQLLPDRLAGSFEAWADDLGLDGEVKRIGMKAGRQVLPRLLGGYYRDLSRALEEAGFAPANVQTAKPWRQRPVPAVRQDDLDKAAGVSTGEAAQQAARHADSSAGGGELTSSRAAELLMSLPSDALGGEATGRSLKERSLALLADVMPEVSSQPLEPALHERIEATDRVLNHILGNVTPSPQMHGWVDQLSLRMLTAAVADQDFFRQPGHPLLQLLGQLDHVAMFLPDDAAEDDSGISAEVEQLVGKALELDVRDHAAFAPVMQQLSTLTDRYGQRFQQEAQRAIQRLEGQDRRRRARAYVQQQLVQRFDGQQMHRTVAELIDRAWATLLELRFLREGEDGEQLASDWSVLQQLHELCGRTGPDSTDGPGLDKLEESLNAGLSYVGFDPYQTKGMLQKIHEAARRRRAGQSSDDDFVAYQAPHQEHVDGGPLKDIAPEVQSQLMQQIDQLQLGAGLRHRKDGKERRMRLVWCSPDDAEFGFLDGHSGRVRPYSRNTLAAGLHSGVLQLLTAPDLGVADRALDATLQEMREHIRYHETRDGITGLYTHQQFTGRLAELLHGMGAAEQHVLGFLDIDHFEAVTSNCGYRGGEQLLQEVSGLLQTRFGKEAYLAFLGGRRFGFLLRADDIGEAAVSCDAIRREVYSLPFQWQGKSYPVTGSMGIVSVMPGMTDPDSLLSAAEVACATAQEAGGNRMVQFREDDDSISQRRDRLRWLSTAEDVLKAGRIRLWAQSIVPLNADSGLRGHHEVLLRVHDEHGDELDLGSFIAAAEAFQLMADVDRLVIRRTLHWARDNPEPFAALGGVAINLSGISLSDPRLLHFIRAELEHAGVAPDLVSFEVTETAAIASLERAVTIIEGIKDIGCRVALDDFGTGMSSYSYLKSMPVDYVKIDGSFIRDILENPHDQAIVKSINEIAHFMGIRTIAEYVENDAIIERLREIGVDYIQGYAVQRPRALDGFSNLH